MKKWIVSLLVCSNFAFANQIEMQFKPGPLLNSEMMISIVDAFDVRDLVDVSDTSLKTAHRGTQYFYKVYKAIEHKSIFHHEVNKNWNNRFLKLVLGKPEKALPPVLKRIFASRMLISLDVVEAENKRRYTDNSTFERLIHSINQIALTSPVFIIHNFSQLDGNDFMSKSDLIASFPDTYTWKVIGNALLVYPPKYKNIETSDLVDAVTTSYFHKESNMGLSELKEAEYAIRLSDSSVFSDLVNHLVRNGKRRKTMETNYFHLWNGLSLLGKDNKRAALAEFKACENSGFSHPLLKGYIEECLETL